MSARARPKTCIFSRIVGNVRWGILSTGEIAAVFASAARESESAEITAVASRDLIRAQRFADTHGIARAYGHYQQVIDDPQVDAVYVGLPNSLHVEWTTRALHAGKHVLCEKPMATSAADVDTVFDLAAEHGLVVSEGFMFIHHPLIRRAFDIVRSGTLGELRTIRAWHGFTVEEPKRDIRYDADLGGGALADVGCYCIAAAILFTGETPYAAEGWIRSVDGGIDETTWGFLSFSGGARAVFDCSLRIPESAGLMLVGEWGQIEFSSPWLPSAHPELDLVDLGGKRQTITCDAADSYRLEVDSFCEVIRGEASSRVTRELSRGVAATIELLRA